MAAIYVRKPCKRCGGEKGYHSYGKPRLLYCETCDRSVSAEQNVARHICASPDPTVPHFCCAACKEQKAANQRAAGKRAAETRRKRYPNRSVPIDAERFWQQVAMSMVAKAVRKGILPKLDETIACVDCGDVASVYEHRDYSRPLEVVPVCQSCNLLRGTARWPSASHFHFARFVKGEKNLPDRSLSTPHNKVANG